MSAENQQNRNNSTEDPTVLGSGANTPDHRESTETIVSTFHDETNPDYTYALVSGGGDSDTACTVAQEFGVDVDAVVHVNTGTGIEQTRRYVMDRCLDWGLPYIELTSLEDADAKRQNDGVSRQERYVDREGGVGKKLKENPYEELNTSYYGVRRPNDDYKKLVRKMGFPGPSLHWIMYLALKHKPIQNFVETHHDEDEKVTFVSGVRKDESARRAENMSDDGISENWGGCTVISPIAYWTESHVSTYRKENELRSNEVSDILGLSGECLCGSYGDREELRKLKRWGFTDAAKRIEDLEMELFRDHVSKGYVPEEYALWGHGNTNQPDSLTSKEKPQMLLCADCEDSCDPAIMTEQENTSQAEVALQEGAHHTVCDRWFFCPDCETVFNDPIEHRKAVHAVEPGSPYLDDIRWNVREINYDKQSNLDEPVTTDPELTKTQRMKTSIAQTTTGPNHTCEFTPTGNSGISHCTGCGSYEIAPGELKQMISASDEGDGIESLISVETGVLSTVIPHPSIDETEVISTEEELRSVLTADVIVELLVEEMNSVTAYLDTDPSFNRLVGDAGVSPLLAKFGIDARAVLDEKYHSKILDALRSEAADEGSKTKPLQAEYDPNQQNMNAFTGD